MDNIKKLDYRPFTRFCMSIGAVPTSYLAGLTIEEQLLWFCSYLEKEVIPAVNNNAEAVEELQNLYIELKSYVDNYFENLDVQEEINKKLDDMVEQGTLQEIISEYLNSTAIFGFDSVDEMKNATNLIDGSYAKTYGYYAKDDGGSATYYIVNTLPNNKYYEELNNGNYAVLLIGDETNVKQFGAKGDGVTDDSNSILNAINYTGDNKTLILPDGTYLISKQLLLNNGMTFKGQNNSTILISDTYEEKYPAVDDCIIGNKGRTLTSYNIKDIKIENIKIVNHIANTGHLGIIELNGTDNCLIKNCTIEFDNGTPTSHCWGIILLGSNRNTLIDHVNIKNRSPEGSLGGCIWVRGAYPEGNSPTTNINVTNSYFESSAVDEITCIDDGINGCKVEAMFNNCTVIGTANTTLPNFLVSIITVGADSYVSGKYNNMVIKGKCNQYGVELGESNYSDIEKVTASIENSNIEIYSGKGIVARNRNFKVLNCYIKVPTSAQAVQGATVSNCNILGQLNGCIVDSCYIKNSNSYACETCVKVNNSIIECTNYGGVHFFGNTTDVIISNNKIKADTFGIYAQPYNGASISKCSFINNTIERLNNTSNSGSIGIYAPTMTGSSLIANNIISGTTNNEVANSYGYNFTKNINGSITEVNNVEFRY